MESRRKRSRSQRLKWGCYILLLVVCTVLQTMPGLFQFGAPELSADIIDHGITLTGGGALLRGLDKLIESETGIDVHVAEDPLDCVAKGAGAVLDHVDVLHDVLDTDGGHM